MNPYGNGYELHIWRSVYHNGQFSHNLARTEIVHAWTEKQAVAIAQLAGEELTRVNDSLVVRASEEYVYCVRYLGRVVYEYVVKYKHEEEVSDD